MNTKKQCDSLPPRKVAMKRRNRVCSRDFREDLHAVQRVVSTGGNVTYSAPRNADGHSDRAAALALCIKAASGTPHISPFATRRNHNPDMRRVD